MSVSVAQVEIYIRRLSSKKSFIFDVGLFLRSLSYLEKIVSLMSMYDVARYFFLILHFSLLNYIMLM